MNIAKCVIPLNPPSKGEKDCCYPFICQDIGRSRILFPLRRGRMLLLPTISKGSGDVKFCFPLPKGEDTVVTHHLQGIRRCKILFPPSEGGLRGMTLTNISLRQKKVRFLLPHQMKKYMSLLFVVAQTCQTVFQEIHPFQSFVTVSGGAVPPLIQLVQYGHYFAPTVDNNRFLG